MYQYRYLVQKRKVSSDHPTAKNTFSIFPSEHRALGGSGAQCCKLVAIKLRKEGRLVSPLDVGGYSKDVLCCQEDWYDKQSLVYDMSCSAAAMRFVPAYESEDSHVCCLEQNNGAFVSAL